MADNQISVPLPSGLVLEFDTDVPGLSLSLIADTLVFSDDGKRVHIRWQRVPRRALLLHLYDTLSIHGLATDPPLSAALAAWDELHPPAAVVSRSSVEAPVTSSTGDVALPPHSGVEGNHGGRPLDLDEATTMGLGSLLVRSDGGTYLNHVWAICGALKFPLAQFEKHHLHIATELLEYFTRTGLNATANQAWPHAFRHPFVRSYRYRGVVAPLLVCPEHGTDTRARFRSPGTAFTRPRWSV